MLIGKLTTYELWIKANNPKEPKRDKGLALKAEDSYSDDSDDEIKAYLVKKFKKFLKK